MTAARGHRKAANSLYVSYLRVSTQRQGQSGLGIEAQRSAVETYLKGIGGTLLQEHIEVESGSTKNRPVLVQSIAQAKKAGATLVIAKLDRLARKVAFVCALMEAGVEFVAVDFPAANKLLIHIMAAVAEHERMLISERTKAALAVAKSRGVQLGANGKRLQSSTRRPPTNLRWVCGSRSPARCRTVCQRFKASLTG